MTLVPGTTGNETSIDEFIRVSRGLNFRDVCKDFIGFLPDTFHPVLDVGAGAGQNAAALCKMGYALTAVEPLSELLTNASATYADLSIPWISDSLPVLSTLV